MGEQRTTIEQRRALRHRYLRTPAVEMPCVKCGSAMVLDLPERHTIGVTWTWRCPQSLEHLPVRHIDYYTDLDVLAAVDDADALAGARDEIGRLRAALALVLDEMEGCEGRQGMWEDGIDPDYRRAIERGRAALKTGTEGASE